MRNTKAFALAAIAAFSLGMGTAMARSEASGSDETAYWQHQALAKTVNSRTDQIQSGSFDTAATRSRGRYAFPFKFDLTARDQTGWGRSPR
jgi:hypothetical protein